MRIEQRTKLLALGAFALPIVAAFAARYAGEGTGTTQAFASAPIPALPVIVPQPQTNAQPASPLALSPFWTNQPEAPQIHDPAFMPEPTPAIDEPLVLRLTAVMPNGTRSLAVINGKPRRIGDTVHPGWTLAAIDGDARTATVRSQTGEQRVIALSREP